MRFTTVFKGVIASAMLFMAFGANAGNIPQYSFQESRDVPFEFLTDATQVSASYNVADEMIFPGRQTLNAYTGQGFPIGFDFRYGGRVFNQFAIDNNGYILLGYDKVEFKGYSNLFFRDVSRYASNSFYLGMTTTMYAIAEGKISYKLQGEEGSRTLTVEFAHLGVNEPSRDTRGNAIFSLQIVLCEKDGTVKINFIEEESPYSSLGLICGLYGWSPTDAILLTSPGLNTPAEISTETIADMLERHTYLSWSAEDIIGDGHMEPYAFTFTFAPTGEPDFVCDAPADLSVEQSNSSFIVSCKRPENAPATAIMISEKPIEEFPQQGVSYPVMDDKGEFVSSFGDATLIYYTNGENPQAIVPNIKASTRYYVKAFGVNGYPSYSTGTASSLEIVSSHPAPYVMQTSSADGAINIKTIGDDDLIIAQTLNRVETYNQGATGIFGHPEDNCAVGDEIEGGGEIIYIGAPGDFVYDKAAPNRQVFFRAWSVREGRVSKTWINASGVTNPEMPYEPQLSLYSLYEVPMNWIDQTTSSSSTVTTSFIPRTRGNDDEPVVGGISLGTTATLISPVIPHGEKAILNFEWALETERELGDQGDALVQLPEGNEPGVFGNGHSFRVLTGARGNENEIFSTNEYKGTMTSSPSEADRYISGTSTFIPVTVALPETQSKGRVTFQFSTEGNSILYLRNISVTNPNGVESLISQEGFDSISGDKGTLSIISANGGRYEIYAVDGSHAVSVDINAGEGAVLPLNKGIYVVNNHKVVVK